MVALALDEYSARKAPTSHVKPTAVLMESFQGEGQRFGEHLVLAPVHGDGSYQTYLVEVGTGTNLYLEIDHDTLILLFLLLLLREETATDEGARLNVVVDHQQPDHHHQSPLRV